MARRDTSAILEILNHLVASPHNGAERRERCRAPFPYCAMAVLIGLPAAPRVKVVTRNLSTTGVGLLTRRAFQKGEVFVLPLGFPAVKTKLALCRVQFARYAVDGMYDVGAKFLAALDCDDDRQQASIPQGWVQQAREAAVALAAHASARPR